jgi:two-component system NarL family sensor kinase
MSGYARDEVIGHTSNELRNFQDPVDRDIQLVQPLLRSGVVRNFELNFRTKNGAFRTLLSSAELLELAGEQCILVASSDITERKTLEQELMNLTAQLFRLQDEERRKIARELHDGTAQNLFAISVNLAKVGQLDNTQKEEMQQLIAECVSLGDESLQEIRTLSYLLHPPLLEQVGLVGALQWYVEGFSKRSGIYVDMIAEPMERLSSEIELALFRIVQEALTNVRRHSGSGTASIRLEKLSGEVSLAIRDQGHGLPGKKQPDGDDEFIEMGVGIPGMRQRLLQLGGRLEITSNDDGATIRAVVPLANGAHHVANPSRGRS